MIASLPITVLIVDDHAGFRASARRLLEAEGYAVVGEAADGGAAIEAARQLTPDVVLLDLQLPDISGFAVAEALTAGAAGPAVVITSTRDAADFQELARRSGARGFVPKAELGGDALAAVLGPAGG
jgi:DNA-binding NarL/FixJ family response regulator